MILLTICVSCRSVLKIECKKTEDGKGYVPILPVLLEIEDISVYDETWNEIKGENMPKSEKWSSYSFCSDTYPNSHKLFLEFNKNTESSTESKTLQLKSTSSGEYIYYYDLRFYNLKWNAESEFGSEEDLGYIKDYFYFSIPDKDKVSKYRHGQNDSIFEQSFYDKPRIDIIKQKMPGSPANQLVLI